MCGEGAVGITQNRGSGDALYHCVIPIALQGPCSLLSWAYY